MKYKLKFRRRLKKRERLFQIAKTYALLPKSETNIPTEQHKAINSLKQFIGNESLSKITFVFSEWSTN